MAHTDIVVKKRTGQEIERLFLSICAGMRRGAQAYKIEKDVSQIKRAVDMPRRVEKRIQALADSYGSEYLESCLFLAGGTIDYPTMLSEITNMKVYADSLVGVYQDNQDWDEIAGLILLQVEDESKKYVVPFPENYIDIWGE